MKLKYLFFLFLIISCSVNKMSSKSSSEQTHYGLKEFDMEAFKGKWLTTSKNNLGTYRIFNINKILRGKLIFLTDSEVRIIWGNSEEISYYRPRNYNKNIVRKKIDSIQALKVN